MFLARRPSPKPYRPFPSRLAGPAAVVRPHRHRQCARPRARASTRQSVAIGRGQGRFRASTAALMAWKQFDMGWVETFPRHAPVAIGTVVAVLIRHLGFWSLNGCRVLYCVGGL